MENQNEIKKEEVKPSDCCKNGRGWHGHRPKGFWLAKLLVFLLFIAVIFGIGFASGNWRGAKRFNGGYYPMMGRFSGMMGAYHNNNFSYPTIMKGWRNISQENTAEIFGAVSKIEGTKITVIDNGNQEKIINSVSDTKIVSAGGQVGISALKTEQNISAVGKLDNNQLQAVLIRIY